MKKSDLPVGSVVTIGSHLAVKYASRGDEGFNWRYVATGDPVDYDDAHKAFWDLVSVPMEWRPTRWWRVMTPEGALWAETSSEEEARGRPYGLQAAPEGSKLQRSYFLASQEALAGQVHEWRDVED